MDDPGDRPLDPEEITSVNGGGLLYDIARALDRSPFGQALASSPNALVAEGKVAGLE